MRIDKKDLGAVIKAARNSRGMTQEVLAEKVGIGTRHIMSIENEGGNPSFDVLYRLIRELYIPADAIFYPEHVSSDSWIDEYICMLNDCDERSKSIIIATIKAALESQKVM